jgi:hypothetical protein
MGVNACGCTCLIIGMHYCLKTYRVQARDCMYIGVKLNALAQHARGAHLRVPVGPYGVAQACTGVQTSADMPWIAVSAEVIGHYHIAVDKNTCFARAEPLSMQLPTVRVLCGLSVLSIEPDLGPRFDDTMNKAIHVYGCRAKCKREADTTAELRVDNLSVCPPLTVCS